MRDLLAARIAAEGIMKSANVQKGLPRWVEIAVSLSGLIVAAPLLLLSSALVALTSRGPILFRQKRVGRNGRTFVLYKLRTMYTEGSGPQITAGDDTRITPPGSFLRRTKIDELPELWNVLKGEMSLVGPRPEVPGYVDLEDPLWRRVLETPPGITDPVTLRLRNEEALLAGVEGDRESFYLRVIQPFKMRGYLEYQRQRSWSYDAKIILKTIIVVLFPHKAPPPVTLDAKTAWPG
jgi:lipopolysaccharide/colanic/teichoic acid biosynthesis glycosyltransferase